MNDVVGQISDSSSFLGFSASLTSTLLSLSLQLRFNATQKQTSLFAVP